MTNLFFFLMQTLPAQVAGAKVGLQHNLGLGGACVITMYKKPDEWRSFAPKRPVSGAMGFPTEEVDDIVPTGVRPAGPAVRAKL